MWGACPFLPAVGALRPACDSLGARSKVYVGASLGHAFFWLPKVIGYISTPISVYASVSECCSWLQSHKDPCPQCGRKSQRCCSNCKCTRLKIRSKQLNLVPTVKLVHQSRFSKVRAEDRSEWYQQFYEPRTASG